jgi:hypothetical protein
MCPAARPHVLAAHMHLLLFTTLWLLQPQVASLLLFLFWPLVHGSHSAVYGSGQLALQALQM